MTSSRIRLISFIIIAYMITCLAWWTVLLLQKNNSIYYYQDAISTEASIDLPDHAIFQAKHQRQKYMIIGEGIVFGMSLIFGIWVINKAAQDEFKVARLKNNFLVSITHELKTPIASIKMILETLKNKPHIEKETREKIGLSALSETNRLESMVNKLLLSAKIEDHYQYNFEEINVHDFISKVIAKYPFQHSTSKVTINCPLDITVEVDQEAFTSVIQNLVENAIKYSDQENTITINVKQDQKDIILKCIDEGLGIADSEKKEVLKKFYRIGNEEFRSKQGTGLGLFIVNEIIKSHQGQINILDNKPKGTIIKIQIPIKQNIRIN